MSRSGSKRSDDSSSAAICSASQGLDRIGLAARSGLGLFCECLDLIHSLDEDLPQRHTLAPAHLNKVGERLFEYRRGGFPGGLVLRLVAFRLDHLDHALDRQQAVDARRHRIDLAGEYARDLDDRGEHLFVDTDRRERIGALDVQIGVHRTPRQHLAGALFGECLEFVPSGRQPHPKVEPLGIDGLQFPFERVRSAGTVASGKAGHARQHHRVKLS